LWNGEVKISTILVGNLVVHCLSNDFSFFVLRIRNRFKALPFIKIMQASINF
jgi:hypothetical protein